MATPRDRHFINRHHRQLAAYKEDVARGDFFCGMPHAESYDMTYMTNEMLLEEILAKHDRDTREKVRQRQRESNHTGALTDSWDNLIGPPVGTQGKRISQGERCMQAAKAGVPLNEILITYPHGSRLIKSSIVAAVSEWERKNSTRRKVIVCWLMQGATQTGKTTAAMQMALKLTGEEFADKACYTLTKTGRNGVGQSWFDGYNRQRVLILDEYKGDEYFCTDLLNWLNPSRPCSIPFKGGQTWANWEFVIITTNNDIETWREPNGLSYTPENRDALMVRIHFIWNFTAKGVYTVKQHNAVRVSDPPPLNARMEADVDAVMALINAQKESISSN